MFEPVNPPLATPLLGAELSVDRKLECNVDVVCVVHSVVFAVCRL